VATGPSPYRQLADSPATEIRPSHRSSVTRAKVPKPSKRLYLSNSVLACGTTSGTALGSRYAVLRRDGHPHFGPAPNVSGVVRPEPNELDHQIRNLVVSASEPALLGQRRGQRSTLFYLRVPLRWTPSNLRCLSRTTLGFRPPPDYGSGGVGVRTPRGAQLKQGVGRRCCPVGLDGEACREPALPVPSPTHHELRPPG
jgi:hypothetical protein